MNADVPLFSLEDIPYHESGQLNSQLEPVFHTFSESNLYTEQNSPDQLPQSNISFEKLKIVFIGNTGVGKTTLIDRLTNKQFTPSIKPTNGYEVSMVETKFRKRTYSLTLWDSSGDEKYEQILRAFYRDVNAVVFVFDLNNEKSFEDLEFWLNQAKEFVVSPCVPFLLGHKSDLARIVDFGLINELRTSEKLEYFECSSCSGDGCDELLTSLIAKIENNRVSKIYLSTETRMSALNQNLKRDFLLTSELFFAKKNRLSMAATAKVEIKLQKVEQEKRCVLI